MLEVDIMVGILVEDQLLEVPGVRSATPQYAHWYRDLPLPPTVEEVGGGVGTPPNTPTEGFTDHQQERFLASRLTSALRVPQSRVACGRCRCRSRPHSQHFLEVRAVGLNVRAVVLRVWAVMLDAVWAVVPAGAVVASARTSSPWMVPLSHPPTLQSCQRKLKAGLIGMQCSRL